MRDDIAGKTNEIAGKNRIQAEVGMHVEQQQASPGLWFSVPGNKDVEC